MRRHDISWGMLVTWLTCMSLVVWVGAYFAWGHGWPFRMLAIAMVLLPVKWALLTFRLRTQERAQ